MSGDPQPADSPFATSPSPEPAPLPLTFERTKRLKAVCVARCGGDRKAAKPLYVKMRSLLMGMKTETQDSLLDAMARSIGSLETMGLIPKKSVTPSVPTVDSVVASIMTKQSCAPTTDSVCSGTVIDLTPTIDQQSTDRPIILP